MKVLFLSNFGDNIKAGLYNSVFKRINGIIELDDGLNEYKMISIVHEESRLIKLVKKILNKPSGIDSEVQGFQEGEIYCKYYRIKVGLFLKLCQVYFPIIYLDRMYKAIYKSEEVNEADLLYIHGGYPNGYIGNRLKKEKGINYFLTLHGTDINVFPFQSKFNCKIVRDSLNNASYLIFVSKALYNTAKSIGCNNTKFIIIPNGYDKKIFNMNNIRKKKKCKVCFIGNFNYDKRADKLPTIIKEVNRRDDNVKFYLYGDGEYKNLFIKDKDVKNVNLLGRVDNIEIAKALKEMDIMILPSRSEGWPCVISEAIACGVSVVGTNTGGICEAIDKYGQCVGDGEKFEERFAKAIISELEREYEPRDMNNYVIDYSWDNLSKKEYDILQKELKSSIYE